LFTHRTFFEAECDCCLAGALQGGFLTVIDFLSLRHGDDESDGSLEKVGQSMEWMG
jgi:hypothetical protein